MSLNILPLWYSEIKHQKTKTKNGTVNVDACRDPSTAPDTFGLSCYEPLPPKLSAVLMPVFPFHGPACNPGRCMLMSLVAKRQKSPTHKLPTSTSSRLHFRLTVVSHCHKSQTTYHLRPESPKGHDDSEDSVDWQRLDSRSRGLGL